MEAWKNGGRDAQKHVTITISQSCHRIVLKVVTENDSLHRFSRAPKDTRMKLDVMTTYSDHVQSISGYFLGFWPAAAPMRFCSTASPNSEVRIWNLCSDCN